MLFGVKGAVAVAAVVIAAIGVISVIAVLVMLVVAFGVGVGGSVGMKISEGVAVGRTFCVLVGVGDGVLDGARDAVVAVIADVSVGTRLAWAGDGEIAPVDAERVGGWLVGVGWTVPVDPFNAPTDSVTVGEWLGEASG